MRPYPDYFYDIKYLTDKELYALSKKDSVKDNYNAMHFIIKELSCRYKGAGHNGKSTLSYNIVNRILFSIKARRFL